MTKISSKSMSSRKRARDALAGTLEVARRREELLAEVLSLVDKRARLEAKIAPLFAELHSTGLTWKFIQEALELPAKEVKRIAELAHPDDDSVDGSVVKTDSESAEEASQVQDQDYGDGGSSDSQALG
ncbi:hypothetical protein [Corynebacterium sp. 13CS0277]|uniref:hypothetical protein n=1 Tax=Corynebacterium sp. 13CS0277 TaxID=2071994 RepID=UPI0013050132|nr:hypothetical protein [Corynebacterium sp. 13CS0277]